MIKKLMLIAYLILWSSMGIAQEIIRCKIVDEQDRGIPYASVGIVEKKIGVVAFEDGSFSFQLKNSYTGDTLVISAIGYKKRKIAYDDFVKNRPKHLQLKEEVFSLDAVTILPEKLSFSRLGIRSKSSRNNFGLDSPMKGATVAVLFDEVDEAILISEVSVSIGKINMDSIQLRCRIYEQDPISALPGKDLLQKNLIAVSTQKKERLNFKLQEDLWIDRPFYVGFEWVMTKSQFTRLEKAKEAYPLDFIKEILEQNPAFNYTINENKRIILRDSLYNVINKVEFSKDQIEILEKRDAISPMLQFKIKMKGEKTYAGSPITQRWRRIPHEALVSIKVGKSEEQQELRAKYANPSPEKYVEIYGKRIPETELEAFLKEKMEEWKIPAISLAVFSDNRMLYKNISGYADYEQKIPIKESSIFEGASMSKPLFAYFLMKYVEKGLLDLDRPLYEYLPYPDIEHDDRYKKITARMVLNHSSGFPNWRSDFPENKLFISFEPGTKYQYSGEGFQYLAKVLAHLLNTDEKGLEAAFQQEVAASFGMQHTRFVQNDLNLQNKVDPHMGAKKLPKTKDTQSFGAAYSIHSEALDFSKWLMGLLNEEGLTKESYEELFAEQIVLDNDPENLNGASAWTLGFAKYTLEEGDFYVHGGNNKGFTSGFFIEREAKIGAVVFTNANQVSDFVIEFFMFLKDYED
ncbi:MAG: serine hydrolase [Bacteroidota bacterium]